MIQNLLLAFSTVSLLYSIAVALFQFLEISKKDFNPKMTFTLEPTNIAFGVATSTISVAFLAFHLIINHFVPVGIESIFPIEKNKWSKFFFYVMLGMMTFFYAGNYGVISGVLLFLTAFFNLIFDFRVPQQDQEDAVELENM